MEVTRNISESTGFAEDTVFASAFCLCVRTYVCMTDTVYSPTRGVTLIQHDKHMVGMNQGLVK